MSQIPNENDDDNRNAASVVKIEQPDEVTGQEAQQQEHFDLHQNPLLDWTLKTESTSAAADDNDGNDLKELKVMIANLEAKNQTLQGKVENLESKAENRAMKENAEHKANYQALETRLKDEFAEMLAEQQKQMMAQFQAQFNSLEQRLKETEQRARMENNEVEQIGQADHQEMAVFPFPLEMDENEMQQSEEGDEEEVGDEEENDDEEEDEEGNDEEEDRSEEEETVGEEDEDDDEGRPPQPERNITRKTRGGKTIKYRLLKTVKSMDELDNFRHENYCVYGNRKPVEILVSQVMPCKNKKYGKTCDFELYALPSAELDSRKIHIYAHSHHSNHSLKTGIRYKTMPDANPPAIYRTQPDDIKWTFQGTFPDNGKVEKFRKANDCRCTTKHRKNGVQCRYYCYCKYTHDCNFMLVAIKTTKKRYHVYKHGKHSEHSARKPKKDQTEEYEGDDDDYEEGEETDEEEEGDEEDEAEADSEDRGD